MGSGRHQKRHPSWPWQTRVIALRHRVGVNTRRDLIKQAVPHGPDHEFLLRPDAQLVLYAVEGVPDGHCAVAPLLGDLGVGPAAGEQRQRLRSSAVSLCRF